jgi:hypothetical protein
MTTPFYLRIGSGDGTLPVYSISICSYGKAYFVSLWLLELYRQVCSLYHFCFFNGVASFLCLPPSSFFFTTFLQIGKSITKLTYGFSLFLCRNYIGRRRKEHIKHLEQLQREQSTDKSEEIDRLRQQIEALTRENDNLKSQMYSGPYSSASSDSRFDSMSSLSQYEPTPGASVLSSLSMAGPSIAVASSSSGGLIPNVTRSFAYQQTASPLGSPGGNRSPSVFSSISQQGAATRSVSSSANPLDDRLVVMGPCDRRAVRAHLRELFSPLLDPNVHSVPALHLSALAQLAPMLPKALRPTDLQLQRPHYFGVDFLPSPTLRDALINYGDDVSRNFVLEVFDVFAVFPGELETQQPQQQQHRQSLSASPVLQHGHSATPAFISSPSTDVGQVIIWGEDYLNEMAWEMSTAVFDRWGWLLGRDWISRSNFWRRQRGETLIAEIDYFQ